MEGRCDRKRAAGTRHTPERRYGRPAEPVDVPGIPGEDGTARAVDEAQIEGIETDIEPERGTGDGEAAVLFADGEARRFYFGPERPSGSAGAPRRRAGGSRSSRCRR